MYNRKLHVTVNVVQVYLKYTYFVKLALYDFPSAFDTSDNSVLVRRLSSALWTY